MPGVRKTSEKPSAPKRGRKRPGRRSSWTPPRALTLAEALELKLSASQRRRIGRIEREAAEVAAAFRAAMEDLRRMARAAGASAGARRAVAGFALEIRDTFRERWVALSERHLDAYGVSPTLRAELQARRVAVLSGDDAGQQPDGLTPMDRAVVAGQVTLPDDELAAALGVSRQRVAARRCELIERDPVLSDLLERERGDLLRLASGRRGAQPEDRERLLSRRSAFNAKRR